MQEFTVECAMFQKYNSSTDGAPRKNHIQVSRWDSQGNCLGVTKYDIKDAVRDNTRCFMMRFVETLLPSDIISVHRIKEGGNGMVVYHVFYRRSK